MRFSSSLLLVAAIGASALDLTLNDEGNVKDVLSTIAYDMMTFYHGNETGQTPGILPGPCENSDACYYWWEAGAMFGSLINYWQYTGDSSYNNVVHQALQFQRGENNNYDPRNQSSDMGNDDQAFWAFSAMDAAEANFPEPPSDEPSWLSLAVAVFNFQASEWDTTSCGGGLHWQVFEFNQGYNLKNSVSNGGFFQLAARLARYTGNATYADWAERMYDWMAASPLMTEENNSLIVWDSTDSENNCTDASHYVWSYNAGMMISGSAYMYNYTNGSATWADRLSLFLNGSSTYFPSQYGGNVMSEISCEVSGLCNNDQSSFKAYLARWMAVSTQLAPFTASEILPKLSASASAAARQCIGGPNGRMCGRRWYSTTWDGSSGVGQQMSALSVIGANLLKPGMVPLSANTGGTSKANASSESATAAQGSTGSSGTTSQKPLRNITTKDKAGAGILTIIMAVTTVGGAVFMSWE